MFFQLEHVIISTQLALMEAFSPGELKEYCVVEHSVPKSMTLILQAHILMHGSHKYDKVALVIDKRAPLCVTN